MERKETNPNHNTCQEEYHHLHIKDSQQYVRHASIASFACLLCLSIQSVQMCCVFTWGVLSLEKEKVGGCIVTFRATSSASFFICQHLSHCIYWSAIDIHSYNYLSLPPNLARRGARSAGLSNPITSRTNSNITTTNKPQNTASRTWTGRP